MYGRNKVVWHTICNSIGVTPKINNMNQKDIAVFYPMYTGKIYKPFRYSFLGTISSFSNASDAFDFAKECFRTEDECQKECDRLNDGTEFA